MEEHADRYRAEHMPHRHTHTCMCIYVVVVYSPPPPTTPTTGCTFWGVRVEYPPPYFWGGASKKKHVSGKAGTVGGLYEGKIMKKWGRASFLIGSCQECSK